MRSFRVACLALALLSLKPAHASAPFAVISGRVVDGVSKAPVEGAVVRVEYFSSEDCWPCHHLINGPANILTGADGRFSFELPEPVAPFIPRYQVQASKAGYPIGAFGVRRPVGHAAPIDLVRGQHFEDAEVPLFRRALVQGVVTDETGRPAPNVFVDADPGDDFERPSDATDEWQRKLRRGIWDVDGFTRTDTRGHYVLVLAAGEYVLRPSYLAPTVLKPVAPEVRVHGAAVRVLQVSLQPGEVLDRADFQLGTANAHRVEGQLTFPTGRHGAAVMDIRVTRVGASQYPTPSRSFVHDAPDPLRFAIDGLVTGTYRIDAMLTSNQMSTATGRLLSPYFGSTMVTVGDADVTDAPIEMTKGATVSGTIRFDELSAIQREGVAIELEPIDGTRGLGRGTWGDVTIESSTNATFIVEDVRPGKYRLIARASDHGKAIVLDGPPPPGRAAPGLATLGAHDLVDGTFDVGSSGLAGIAVTIQRHLASLRGTARDKRGASLREAWVVAWPNGAEEWADPAVSGARIAAARVAVDGRYLIEDLPPGDYQVALIDDDAMTKWPSRSVLQLAARRAMRVSIPRHGRTTLDMTDVESTSVAVRMSSLVPFIDVAWQSTLPFSDSTPSGGGTVLGVVRDENGNPVSDATVWMTRRTVDNGQPALELALSFGYEAQRRSDATGRFRIDAVPPGRYTVHAESSPEWREAGIRRFAEPDEAVVRRTWVAASPSDDALDANAGFDLAEGREKEVNLTLSDRQVRTTTIEGTISMPKGFWRNHDPVLQEIDPPAREWPGSYTFTEVWVEPSGKFRIRNVPAGRYLLTARFPVPRNGPPFEVLWAVAPVATSGAPVSGLALRFDAGRTVSGHMAFEGPRPPENEIERLEWILQSEWGSLPRLMQSDLLSTPHTSRDGKFRVDNIPPGQYSVDMRSSGWAVVAISLGGRKSLEKAPIVVKSDDVPNVVITLRRVGAGGRR